MLTKLEMKLALLVTIGSLVFTCTKCSKPRDKLFFVQKHDSGEGDKKLLVVTWTSEVENEVGGCEIFTDEELIKEVLKSTKEREIQTKSEEEMRDLMEDCVEIMIRKRRQAEDDVHAPEPNSDLRKRRRNPSRQIRRNSSRQNRNKNSERNAENPNESSQSNDIMDTTTLPYDLQEGPQGQSTTPEGYSGWPVIWPGTKWCGAGDIAKNYDDLGLHADTDKCCRAHDLCNDTMAPKETKNNLTNNSPFTKLSCQCDNDFYDCLDRVNSVTSNTIGNMYFNLLKRTCYTMDYPASKKCKRYRSLLKITCKEYEKNTNAPKVYRWQSAKRYKKIPIPGPLTITLPF